MKTVNFLKQAKIFLIADYGKTIGVKIYNGAVKRYNDLCAENDNEPQAMHQHTRIKIYPCIAIIDAQIKEGVNRDIALQFMFKFIEYRSYNGAKIMAKLMKIPGIYKKVPMFFGNMTKKNFGTSARFDAVFYEISKDMMFFHMTKCPYNDLCVKYGYPEITKAFCRGDDIVYGNMHPKLLWGRTKTIGDGDEYCNFKITVVK